jgi:hypothetical protein
MRRWAPMTHRPLWPDRDAITTMAWKEAYNLGVGDL